MLLKERAASGIYHDSHEHEPLAARHNQCCIGQYNCPQYCSDSLPGTTASLAPTDQYDRRRIAMRVESRYLCRQRIRDLSFDDEVRFHPCMPQPG